MTGGLFQLVCTDIVKDNVLMSVCANKPSRFIPGGRYHHHSSELVRQSCNVQTLEDGKLQIVCTLGRLGDLVGPLVWLELCMQELPHDIFEIFDSIKLTFGGQLWEEFDGTWLRILFRQDASLRPETVTDNKIVYPLSFAALATCFPLISVQDHELKVHITMKEGVSVHSPQLVTEYMYLELNDRRWFATNPLHYVSWTKNQQSELVTVTDDSSEPFKMLLTGFGGPTRELIVQVEQLQLLHDSPWDEPVDAISFRMNDHDRHDVHDPVYYRKYMARRYGVSEHDIDRGCLYYIPFDNTPCERTPSGTLNIDRVDSAQLWLTLKPGKYKVTVCGRVFNMVDVYLKTASLRWPLITRHKMANS